MMVTHVRGHFNDVHGHLVFDPDKPESTELEVTVDAALLWTGEPARDAHLKSSDFLDVARFPTITYKSRSVELVGALEANMLGDISIRGVTRPLTLHVRFLGTWQTPWWEDGADHGPKTRAGFVATGRLNRQDFGVSWNSALDRGGVVVSDEIDITVDAEAILEQR